MTVMLTAKELATLYTKLEVPVSVADMLDRGTPLTDDESFALLIAFSEMAPDKALIAMACCTQIIASRIEGDPALTSSLGLQANFILDDYAPQWLRQQADTSGKVIYADWTVYMQEDLEAMSDLLMMCVDIFGESSVAAAEICTIMQDQASAHAEVLDTVLPTDMAKAIEAVSELTYGGNVIPFPAARRA